MFCLLCCCLGLTPSQILFWSRHPCLCSRLGHKPPRAHGRRMAHPQALSQVTSSHIHTHTQFLELSLACVRACVRMCVRACVRMCVRACVRMCALSLSLCLSLFLSLSLSFSLSLSVSLLSSVCPLLPPCQPCVILLLSRAPCPCFRLVDGDYKAELRRILLRAGKVVKVSQRWAWGVCVWGVWHSCCLRKGLWLLCDICACVHAFPCVFSEAQLGQDPYVG